MFCTDYMSNPENSATTESADDTNVEEFDLSSRSFETYRNWLSDYAPFQTPDSKRMSGWSNSYFPSSDTMSMESQRGLGHGTSRGQDMLSTESEIVCGLPHTFRAIECLSSQTEERLQSAKFGGTREGDVECELNASQHWVIRQKHNDCQELFHGTTPEVKELFHGTTPEVLTKSYMMPKVPTIVRGIERCPLIHADQSIMEYFDEVEDGSHLFVTYDNAEKLCNILVGIGLEVKAIENTRFYGVLVVLFNKHRSAKQAFFRQKEIGIKMVPPTFTIKNWYRNPNPKFHVMFMTRRRLSVKTGKSLANSTIGDFLMTDANNELGCVVWADQMKGHRLRVVAFIGKFMHLDGVIEERLEKDCFEKMKFIGWISTTCSKTREKFVDRVNWNTIEEYVYDWRDHALE